MSSTNCGSNGRLMRMRSAVLVVVTAVVLQFSECRADTDAGDVRVMQKLLSAIGPGGLCHWMIIGGTPHFSSSKGVSELRLKEQGKRKQKDILVVFCFPFRSTTV